MTPLSKQKILFLIFQVGLLILLGHLNAFAQESAAPKPPEGMVYIPEGYFQMGTSSGRDDEKPMHFVYTSAYFIDKFEVSNAQYMEFIDATGRAKPKYWQDENFNSPDAPVVGVDWHDAMEYAKWKNRRLPTEAEWEKAARGNDGRLWPWGDKWKKGFVPYFVNISGEEDQYKFTAPVTYYESGASPFGLFNTAGNVWEWCLDWYLKDYYRISPEINPPGPESGSATMKSLRGGSWANSIDSVRVVQRARNLPNTKNEIYGFRTVLPIP
jgi:iron(II)-dependent oxidoreductase